MINFLSKEDAQRAFGTAQSEYHAVFCTKPATINYFSEVREWSKASKTAREIMKDVEESDVVINFVGMQGGFQCFDNTADNHITNKHEPTIYIDLRGRLRVYVRTPHENILARSQTRDPNMVTFDNRIALLHELGHARQYIERPEWYNLYAEAKAKADFRDELELKARGLWERKLATPIVAVGGPAGGIPPAPGIPHAPGAPPAPGPPGPPGPPGLPGARGGLSTKQKVDAIMPKTTERAKSQAWFVVLDVDNIQRHEWPICKEMGLPLRMNYTDLSA